MPAIENPLPFKCNPALAASLYWWGQTQEIGNPITKNIPKTESINPMIAFVLMLSYCDASGGVCCMHASCVPDLTKTR